MTQEERLVDRDLVDQAVEVGPAAEGVAVLQDVLGRQRGIDATQRGAQGSELDVAQGDAAHALDHRGELAQRVGHGRSPPESVASSRPISATSRTRSTAIA